MQHRTAFGQNRNVEIYRKPVHDAAQLLKHLGRAASLGAQPRKVAGGVQLEQPRPLIARPRYCLLETASGLVVMTLALPDSATQPDDLGELIFFLSRLGQAFGFAEADACLFKPVRAQLIFRKYRHIRASTERAVCLAPGVDAALMSAKPVLVTGQQCRPAMQQHVAICIEAYFHKLHEDPHTQLLQCSGRRLAAQRGYGRPDDRE